jgi:hypothetical protein
MRRLAVLLSIAAVLLASAVALAANPKKGGLYSGLKQGGSVSKRITLKVAKNGKSAKANLFCAGTLSSTMKNIAISKGKFSGVKKNGSVVIWRLKGKFTSKTTASARAALTAVCDGGIVKLTLTLVH